MRKPVEGILWFIILLFFSIVLGVLLIGGTISLFLAPRMVPVVWFGFCIFCILSIHQAVILVRDLRARRGGAMKLYTLVFLLPVFLLATATPHTSTLQMLPNQNISFGAKGTPDRAENPSPTPEPAETPTPLIPAASPDPEETPAPAETPVPEQTPMPEMSVEEMPACVLNEGSISGEEKGPFEESLYTPPQELFGQAITLHGFVYKDDSFPPDTILVSRLMITCCAADAMIVGFHIRVEDADDFTDDEWIRVTGTVQHFSMDMYGEAYDLPILTGGAVTRCEAPPAEEAYVYP